MQKKRYTAFSRVLRESISHFQSVGPSVRPSQIILEACLVAHTQLNTRLCPSVRWSVRDHQVQKWENQRF